MKPSTHLIIAVCVLWIGGIWYWIKLPPAPPPPFPDEENLIPTRARFNPTLAAALNSAEMRDIWQKPEMVMAALGDIEGMSVADIGCGTGYFTIPLAEKVGDSGVVYASDIQAELLEELREKLPNDLRDRVKLILGEAYNLKISEKVDIILLVQVLGEVSKQKEFLGLVRNIMHQDTRLIIIDSKHITNIETGFTRPLNMAKLLRELNALGFELVPYYDPKTYDFLPKQFFLELQLKRR